MIVTPRKIEYAKEKEQILYESLLSLANIKQEELKNLINSAIESNRNEIIQEVKNYQFVDVELVVDEVLTVRYARDLKKCTNQIQELVITRLNNAIAKKLTESVETLKENYLGTLKRCLLTLEENNTNAFYKNDPNPATVSEALHQVFTLIIFIIRFDS